MQAIGRRGFSAWALLTISLFCTTPLARRCFAQAQVLGAPRESAPSTSRPITRGKRVVSLQEVVVSSPDGRIKFVLSPDAERLVYSVKMANVNVIEPSSLKMSVDTFDLASGVIFVSIDRFEVNETYPWHGAHSTAVNHCNGAVISFTNDLSMISFKLEIRVFDDGAAYRWIVPGAENVARTPDEYSEFVVPSGSMTWFADFVDGGYESTYQQQKIDDIKAGQSAGPPVTFQLPNGAGYAVIAEGDLVNYAGMGLESDGRRGWITALGHRQPVSRYYELHYGRDQAKRLGQPATVSGTITTPWRVVMAGPDLNTLVNSTILANLCPPPDPKLFPQGISTPWVSPGTAVWKFLDGGADGRGGPNTLENAKEFSRLAALIGAKYQILESFAYAWPDAQIKELVDYSNAQGVRLIFWRHSNQLRTAEEREQFFSRLHRLGVAGAKIDFFDREPKENVDLYTTLSRLAAENQLLVVYHGANKQTGTARTFPNEMVREAVRGMENSDVTERARHETILPFTAYVAGPVDYTTMVFGWRRADTTWAHQIACLATFSAPLLTVVAHPQSILDSPARDVIESIKPTWDETIVLPDSRIGDLSIYARRSGKVWTLAVMTARKDTSTIAVPLSFLAGGSYSASYVRDDMTKPDAVTTDSGTATRSDTIQIKLAPGGGFVGRFTQK